MSGLHCQTDCYCLWRGLPDSRREDEVDKEGDHDCHDHHLEQPRRDLPPLHPDLHLVHHPDLAQFLHHLHQAAAH